MSEKVLITGHQGYIGSILTPIIQSAGYEVFGLDTNYYDNDCSFVPSTTEVPNINKDIRDINENDLEGFDAIIHLAALSNDPLSNLRPEWTYDINHKASVRLATLGKTVGVKRFIFSSSCSMHGSVDGGKVYESTPVKPLTPYGESKIMAETDISTLADINFSPTFLRNGTVYGISPKLRLDIVLNNLVGWAVTTGKVVLYTDGTPWRPLIHVEDVCNAFLLVLQAPIEMIHNQVFHVGFDDENYQIRQLAEIVQSVVPDCDLEFSTNHDGDQRTYIADFGKISQTFPEFKPQWNAKSGAEQLYQAYQRSEMSFDHFMGNRFMRLKQIDHLIQNNRVDDTLRWLNSSDIK
tara:strand:+ start:2032 stop:3081 length:1050 start_codon:yes stop_codon:yes gene_type:complete